MIESAQQIFLQNPYIRRVSSYGPEQLDVIDEYLKNLLRSDSDLINKTHFFHGRFENIYVKDSDNEAVKALLQESVSFCAELLNVNAQELSIGYWFNLMGPGHITDWHTHDDLDELISGVVYLKVPENSGDLVLKKDDEEIILPPITGHFIFFSPQTYHSVTENKSAHQRLSIGMNIGLKTGLQYRD